MIFQRKNLYPHLTQSYNYLDKEEKVMQKDRLFLL